MARQYVGGAGEILTGPEMAAALTRALGRTVTFSDVPFEVSEERRWRRASRIRCVLVQFS